MAIKTILIIDDSATERLYLSKLLSKNGFEVSTASNGDEGIEKSKTVMPDLIMIDVLMPEPNGFQVTKALSSDPVTRHIPILICSGKGQQVDRVWGMRQGAKGYITKPVNPTELLQKISEIADRSATAITS